MAEEEDAEEEEEEEYLGAAVGVAEAPTPRLLSGGVRALAVPVLRGEAGAGEGVIADAYARVSALALKMPPPPPPAEGVVGPNWGDDDTGERYRDPLFCCRCCCCCCCVVNAFWCRC